MSRDDFDPYGNYYFALEINKIEVAHFQECSGLKSSTQVFEIEEGGLNGRKHKRVGQSRWDNITLRYATSASTFMIEWRDQFLQDHFGEVAGGCITLKKNNGETVRRYTFKRAWPVSWEGPTFNSGGSEIAIETLEIAHTGLVVSTD